ncbi:Imm32 family immunity protein [Catelliglobosispora koreensis]|uniref:Imm32 family immunity protein n=1 Tax=Catelliglobosispora koreensis TaxID=129052 RepID=UPI0003A89069|nr:hypothetical protein [Catelliglobosispora koreensis]
MTSANSAQRPVRMLVLEVPAYSDERGLWRELDDGHVSVDLVGEDVNLRADRSGLVWLATQLLALAGEDVPDGYHHHIDRVSGELAEGSLNLIIEYDADLWAMPSQQAEDRQPPK